MWCRSGNVISIRHWTAEICSLRSKFVPWDGGLVARLSLLAFACAVSGDLLTESVVCLPMAYGLISIILSLGAGNKFGPGCAG